jgi:glc operon protein GlcG
MPPENDAPVATSSPAAAASPLAYGPPISLDAARRVMAAAEAEAAANGWAMVVSIVDSGGHLVMLHRLDQANIGAVEVSQRKAAAAINFRRSTKVFEEALAAGGPGLRMLAFAPELIPVEGGVPLVEDGRVIGAIGVSGMQSFQDGQVASAGARALGVPAFQARVAP